jgi:hypothetical protein
MWRQSTQAQPAGKENHPAAGGTRDGIPSLIKYDDTNNTEERGALT